MNAKHVPAEPSQDSTGTTRSQMGDASHQLGNSGDYVCDDNELGAEWTGNLDCYGGAKNEYVDDLPIDPPLLVKRRLDSLAAARTFVEDEMRHGKPPAWRDVYHRLATAHSEHEAREAIVALRKLLELEGLLVHPVCP